MGSLFYGYILTRLHTLQGEYVPRLATVMCVAGDLPSVEEFRAIPPCLPLATQYHHRGVDVLAKHSLKRLAAIAKKGPRGKPPTLAEIGTASPPSPWYIYIHVHPKLS